MPESTILVVDDHADIRDALCAYLGQRGFRTRAARDTRQARRQLEDTAVDLVVLDIMMPGEDGLALCRDLRARDRVPVIFLTAVSDLASRIVGLEIGADDYVVKPFEPRELVARIRTVLRRRGEQDEPTPRRRVAFARWILDLDRRELIGADQVSVPLSAAEFRLLRIFLRRPRVVLSRDQLLDLISGSMAGHFERSIDSQVSRLRRKLEHDPREPQLIKTVWGGGYLLDCTTEEIA